MLYHAGDSRHTQNIQINKVIDENEKCGFYFMEKTIWTFLANPIYLDMSFELLLLAYYLGVCDKDIL